MFYDDIEAPKIQCPCGDLIYNVLFSQKSYIDLRPTGVRKYWRLCRGRLQREGKEASCRFGVYRVAGVSDL